MPVWQVIRKDSAWISVVWSDGVRGDVYVYCNNTKRFHPDREITYSYYTATGNYTFWPVRIGTAGVLIQNGVGEIDVHRDINRLLEYKRNPEYLTVQNLMLTVAGEHGRV